MKKFSNLKLSLINVFIIIILIGILFLTIQFFINKQKIEEFSENQCPGIEECSECSNGDNNNNDNSNERMTPYGYRKKKETSKTNKGQCKNNKNGETQQKCVPTNNDAECKIADKKPKENNNLCKFSGNATDEPIAIEEKEYEHVDMDKYILKSKLKSLDLPDKTKFIKDSTLKTEIDIETTPQPTSTELDDSMYINEETSTTPFVNDETSTTPFVNEETSTTPFVNEETSTTQFVNEETSTTPTPFVNEETLTTPLPDPSVIEEPKVTVSTTQTQSAQQLMETSNQKSDDNNNIMKNEQLSEIAKELKEIKKAMFQHDKNTSKSNDESTVHVRKNNKDKDFKLMDDTHPFYNCYDKRKNPYTQFKRYTKEELSKGKKPRKFTDTPYKMYF